MPPRSDALVFFGATGLLGDAMIGDLTLFAREDAVEAAWNVVGPLLGGEYDVLDYAPGTWGPVLAPTRHGLADGESTIRAVHWFDVGA